MEGKAASGVEPLDQRRVSVVCRSTRVDVSLPAHLELVAIIPELVDLVRDHIKKTLGPGTLVDLDTRMGGRTGGSWQLSRLAGSPLSVSETLSQQRVHDGEILILDRRPIPVPAPLFDDALQGLTADEILGTPAWKARHGSFAATAVVIVAAGVSSLAIASQWLLHFGYLPASASVLLALVSITGVFATRAANAPAFACVTAAVCAVAFSALSGLTTVPGAPGPGHLLVGGVTGAVAAALLHLTSARSRTARLLDGSTHQEAQAEPQQQTRTASRNLAEDTVAPVLIAAYLGMAIPLTMVALGAALSVIPALSASAVGACAVIVGLILLTSAPHISVIATRIPIPQVPVPGEDFTQDAPDPVTSKTPPLEANRDSTLPALPTPALLRERARAARAWLSGVLAGSGITVFGGAMLSLSGEGGASAWSAPLAVILVVVLVLRGLSYADQVHASILLSSALTLVAGIFVGAVLTLGEPIVVVVPAAAAVALVAILAWVVVPPTGLSPIARRTVDILETILITSVVPLAVGAMGLYTLIRQR